MRRPSNPQESGQIKKFHALKSTKKVQGFDDFGASNLQNRRHQLAGASWGLHPLWLYLPRRSCALDSIDLSICQRYMTLAIELIDALGIRPLHDVQTWTSRRSSTITYHFQICPPLSFHWHLNPNFVQIQTFLDPDNIISLRKALIILFSECLILTVSLSFLFEACCALSQNCELCGLTPCAECLMHGINLSMFYPLENISQIEL